jgi:hypothetical protein
MEHGSLTDLLTSVSMSFLQQLEKSVWVDRRSVWADSVQFKPDGIILAPIALSALQSVGDVKRFIPKSRIINKDDLVFLLAVKSEQTFEYAKKH